MKKIKSLILAVCFVITATLLSGCGITLELTAESALIKPGESIQLSTEIIDGNGSETLEYSIVSGSASVSASGLLTADVNAIVGSEIVAQSSVGEIKSNLLKFTVEKIAVTGITVSSTETQIEQGAKAVLTAVLAPTNTTETNIVYEITQNATMAEIVTSSTGVKRLEVNSDATVGAVIKVKAHIGSVYSNEILITVLESSNTLKQIVGDDYIKIDKNALNTFVYSPELINSNTGETYSDATFACTVKSGSDKVSVFSTDSKNFTFNILGHGSAVIEVSCNNNSNVQKVEVELDVVVPPTNIMLPGYLMDFKNKMDASNVYQVGVSNPTAIQTIPFILSGENNYTGITGGVCQDFNVTFKYNDETEFNSNYGLYSNNRLEFLKTGKYEVKVTSNSGSRQEISTTYKFNVNNLKNVYTYEQLQTAMGNIESINIIVSEKPISAINSSAVYGYDLVPTFLINAGEYDNELQLFNKLANSTLDANLTQTKNSITINGNGHKINYSYLPLITKQTANDQNHLGSLIFISPDFIRDKESGVSQELTLDPNNVQPADLLKLDTTKYSVNINNLNVVGNFGCNAMSNSPNDWASSDYAISNKGYYCGLFSRGIQIGSQSRMKDLHITIDNVEVSGFSIGMRISSTKTREDVASKLINCKIENMFKAGLELCTNILTIENTEFGLCGQGPIELSSDCFKYAGALYNENQKVTITNSILLDSAISNYETPYFNYFAASAGIEATNVLRIMSGAIAVFGSNIASAYNQQTANLVMNNLNSLIINSSGEFGFVALSFGNGNTSTLVPANEVFDACTETGAMTLAQSFSTITQKYIKISLGEYGSVFLLNLNA